MQRFFHASKRVVLGMAAVAICLAVVETGSAAPPAAPAKSSWIVGSWMTKWDGKDGITDLGVTFKANGSYTLLMLNSSGKPVKGFDARYTLSGSQLTLKTPDGKPLMVGTITQHDANHFVLKLSDASMTWDHATVTSSK